MGHSRYAVVVEHEEEDVSVLGGGEKYQYRYVVVSGAVHPLPMAARAVFRGTCCLHTAGHRFNLGNVFGNNSWQGLLVMYRQVILLPAISTVVSVDHRVF